LVGIDKVEGDSCSIVIRVIGSSGVGSAISKKDGSSGWNFNGNCLRFVGVASDMVIAEWIALMRKFLAKHSRNNSDGAICNGGIMNSSPESGSFEWVFYFEVGVILLYS
jgi:hypothetical protein